MTVSSRPEVVVAIRIETVRAIGEQVDDLLGDIVIFDARNNSAASGNMFRTLILTALFWLIGAPGRIRTCDPRIRNPVLYPTELRAHGDEF